MRTLLRAPGKPFHPPLTDFPVAAYVFAAAFDVISYVAARGADGRVSTVAREAFAAATYVLIAGAIVSLGAVVTGFWDWWKGIDREKTGPIGRAKHTQVWRTINFHAVVMLSVTAIVAADIFVRIGRYGGHRADLLTMSLSVVAALGVSLGAFYGGSLVYDYQFNVESLEGSTVWDETETDQAPADKPPSEW